MNGLLATMALAATLTAAAPSQSDWTADYGEALAVAKRTRRPLLIALVRPSETSLVSRASFAQPQSDTLDQYELCRVDVTTAYGSEVAKAFGATQFPHTAIIDNTGSVVLYRKTGQFTSGEWTATLARYQSGARPAPRPQPAICFT